MCRNTQEFINHIPSAKPDFVACPPSELSEKYKLSYTDFMKTAISIPDPLFDNAERMAKRLGMSRSQFYGKAVDAFIKAQKGKGVKEALDAVYGSEASEV